MAEPFSLGSTIASGFVGWLVGRTMEGSLGALARRLRETGRRRAFADALAEALADFEARHPRLVRDFFDAPFLARADVGAELAKLFSATRTPDAAVIARAYREQFASGRPRVRRDSVQRFLDRLDAALREQWLFWDHYARRDQGRMAAAMARLVDAATRGPPGYRALVQGFLEHYLGTPGRPVAFGGRAAAMLDLNAWYAAGEARHDRLLLTAPAGRGKTAFLARWVAQLPDGHGLVFFPLRADMGTAKPEILFPALAGEIGAHMNWARETPAAQDPPEAYRDHIARLWREYDMAAHGPLTLVLDGLDEMPARERDPVFALFPREPVPGLRFVVSARLESGHDTAEAWAEALHWRGHADHLDLPPLDRDGILDVLASLHAPAAADPDVAQIADRLVPLTEGDPLLVGLYVHEIWEASPRYTRFTLANLAEVRPGLAGYFDKWVARQAAKWERDSRFEDTVLTRPLLTALALLGQARGPLNERELKALLRHAGLDDVGVTVHRLLRPFDSFLRGDGRRRGYVFNHPRLADFFGGRTRLNEDYWCELDGEIIDVASEAYLKWGAEFLAAPRLPTRDIEQGRFGDYLADHYVTHLLEADPELAALRALTAAKWKDFRYLRDGHYAVYVADLDRVRSTVASRLDVPFTPTAENVTNFGLLIRLALILSSIRTLGDNMPPELLGELIKLPPEQRILSEHQILTQIGLYSNDRQRAEALDAVFPHLSEQGRSEALTIADSMTEHFAKAQALTALAPLLDGSERASAVQRAWDAASAIADDHPKVHALTALAPLLDGTERASAVQQARDAASEIADDYLKAHALTALAPLLDGSERASAVQQARNAASASADDEFKAHALTALAPLLDGTERASAVQQAGDAASAIADDSSKAHALTALAPLLDGTETASAVQQAWDAASAIANDYFKANALTALAGLLPVRDLPNVIGRANDLPRDRSRGVIASLLPTLPEDVRPIAAVVFLEADRDACEWWP